ATGLTGPIGATGPMGATGAAGPTASRGVNFGSDVALTGSFQTVLDLQNVNEGSVDNQITTTFANRLIVNATVNVKTTSSTNPGMAICRLSASDGTGPNNGVAAFSEDSSFTTTTLNGEFVELAMTGAVDKAVGTYNIIVQCRWAGSSPPLSAAAGNLTVIATGSS
ncbi:hypothetical protein LCGC14_3128520, partial [marine sediment metagenome]